MPFRGETLYTALQPYEAPPRDDLSSAKLPENTNRLTAEVLYPPHLAAQVERFIDTLQEANDKRPEYVRRDERDYAFLRDFFARLLSGRNERTYEVESPEYQEAKELANRQFPLPPYSVDCIDGRVLGVLKYGASSGIGSSIRVPGGILREFVRGDKGNMMLREHSTFAIAIDAALDNADNGMIAEVFDSHLGCAARAGEENTLGHHPTDAGLYTDVMHKKEMAQATKNYVTKRHGQDKQVITIQTSFNPHNGFLYMGLETDDALQMAHDAAAMHAEAENSKIVNPEFTGSVLTALGMAGKIIDTEDFVNDPAINVLFSQHGAFELDWKDNYVESAQNFWQAIDTMKSFVLPTIREKLQHIYPKLKGTTRSQQVELEERATLLLTNAFSGFLLNGKPQPKQEQPLAEVSEITEAHQHGYSFGEHTEQFVKVYEGGQPPYNISAFVVYSNDKKNIPRNIELASSLIRANRKAGRTIDASGNYTDPEEFEQAVVPVVMQEIVRQDISEEAWQDYEKIDWNDRDFPMPENWDTMSTADFFLYLHKKGIVPDTIARTISLKKADEIWEDEELLQTLQTLEYSIPPIALGINNLRKRTAILYDPDIPTSSRVINQHKAVLPTMSGRNRRNRFIVPFVKTGYPS